jgi:hypothetical protein
MQGKRLIGIASIALAAATTMGIGSAVVANAATTVSASTSVTNHPDTTAAPTQGSCESSPGGFVWAHDFYTSKITAIEEANPANTWNVTITDNGTFDGFADPNTCQTLQSVGSLSGNYELTVTSDTAPNASGLKSNYDGAVSTNTMVADLFNNKQTNIVGGAYNFSYQNGHYVQDTSGQHGSVIASRFSAPFTMKNMLSSKCMNVTDGVYVAGGEINQYTCNAVWHGKVAGAQTFVREDSAEGRSYLLAVSPDGSHPAFFVQATLKAASLSLTTAPVPYTYKTGGFFNWNGLNADDQAFSKSNLTHIVGYPDTGASNQRFTAINTAA